MCVQDTYIQTDRQTDRQKNMQNFIYSPIYTGWHFCYLMLQIQIIKEELEQSRQIDLN